MSLVYLLHAVIYAEKHTSKSRPGSMGPNEFM